MDVREIAIWNRIAREARLKARLEGIYDVAYAFGNLEPGPITRARRMQLELEMLWQ